MMKKSISLLPFSYRIHKFPVSYRGTFGYIEIDVNRSNFRDSKYLCFHYASSKFNPNSGMYFFRFRGDTYYFDYFGCKVFEKEVKI